MVDKIICLLKVSGVSAIMWLLGDIVNPGMMLVPVDGRLDRLFDLGFVSALLKCSSFVFFLSEAIGMFFGRNLINSFLACYFALLSVYILNNFYIMW